MENLEFVRKNHEGAGEAIRIREKNGIPYLTYPLLEGCGGYVHGFSTRLGGVSEGIYKSMNLSFTRGDEEAAVRENFKRIAAAIGFPCENIICSDQTHTTNVRVVTERDRGNGITREKEFYDTDGLVTNVPGLVLATFYADCVPLFFIDPIHRAIGLSHSGWRGTVERMGEKTLRVMAEAFGTRPEDVFTAIGPSICADCYEVSQDVADAFMEAFAQEAGQLLYPKGNGKYQLDLWKANELVLLHAGIIPAHLAVTDICTCCNPDLLFSHRASQGKRGNLGAFLSIS